MNNIKIGRYDHPSITSDWTGWIEGTRADGTTWILYLDENGSPGMYWPEREPDGGCVGDPVELP